MADLSRRGKHILVVDDDPELQLFLRRDLELEGYVVLLAADGAEAVASVRTAHPDLVVLDLVLPVMDGFTALHAMREVSAVPIIVLTARDAEDDKLQALHLGADGYVTKPFRPQVLLARIENVLRRSTRAGSSSQEPLVVDEDLTIDFARNRVILRGTEQPLTATEYRLLAQLVSNAGHVLPTEVVLARVWGADYREEVHYVRLYVSYLRAKIEPDPAHPRYILTEKGLGYRFIDLS
ncbi:MAG TPA: response regulator transcription factor [Chloroflexota bacterium]|jgi:two-component system KDP operon response regulator KdpE|nr:response regulator transcription factor [Chloroflexota bacterium]